MLYDIVKALPNRMVSEGGSLLLIRFFNIGAGFLTVTVLARYLGPADYGIYAFVIAICGALSLGLHLGLPTLIVREIAANYARGEMRTASAIERFSLRLILSTSSVFAIGGAVIMCSPEAISRTGGLEPVIGMAAAISVAMALQQRALAILSGRGLLVKAQFSDGIIKPMLLLFSASILFIASSRSVEMALIAFFLGCIGSLLLSRYFISQTQPKPCGFEVRRGQIGTWLRQLPPFALIGVLGIVQSAADVVILSAFVPIADVGKYKVAALIGAIPANLHSIVVSMLMPRAAAAWARNDKAILSTLAIHASRSSFVAAAAYSIFIVIFGHSLIEVLFGVAYSGIYTVTCVLLLPCLTISFVGSSSTILNMCGESHLNSLIAAGSLAFGLLCMGVFSMLFGAVGTAVAASLTALSISSFSWLAVRRRIGIRCDILASRHMTR
ncbi:oligosaccharide flippase family protein [Mesorhizobium sp. M1169]|uniref:oligosaccharide flippase family protein n=1 Tax=Mesorhizobium sp. M1169 TaxID=2957066 RepID=UPI003335846F